MFFYEKCTDTNSLFHERGPLFASSSGWLHCWLLWVLLLFALAKVGPVLSSLLCWCCFKVFDGVSFFSHMCVCLLLFIFTLPSLSHHPLPVFLWVCAWCLSQLPSSSLSPYSTPPIPSPANGPPSPKFGRDPLSYCLKEINKTVKPRISSFRTLKRTVSVTCQGSSNLTKPVGCRCWHVSLSPSAAHDWSGSE